MKSEPRYKVYRYTSPNGKVYIGQTCRTLHDRARRGGGYSLCPVFWKAIQKYGLENFKAEIISDHLTLDEANWLEQYMIAYHNSTDRRYGYNLSEGGGGTLGYSSPEKSAKISKAKKGHPTSEETRRKLSISHTGMKMPREAVEKTAAAHRGRKRSDETKRKLRKGIADFYNSERGREMARIRAEKFHSKKVIDENGNIYPSIAKAADTLGIEKSTLRKAINDGRSTHGHKCKYYETKQ